MTTIELEPEILEEEHHEEENEDCHLYYRSNLTSICGQMDRDHDRCCRTHEAVDWEEGMTRCPMCGALICLECLLKVVI